VIFIEQAKRSSLAGGRQRKTAFRQRWAMFSSARFRVRGPKQPMVSISQATVEIVDVVRKNHELSLSAVSSMQSSLSRTGLGVELANEAGDAIREIQQGSRHVVDAISQFNETLKLE
jgi:hypothetical protein